MRRGFTLIELLVVVGIIALLIAILVPSLSVAKQLSIRTQCATNLRGLTQGWTIYAHSYDGTVVPGRPPEMPNSTNLWNVGNGQFYRPRWFALLGAATKNYAYNQPDPSPGATNTARIDHKLMLCPGVPEWTNNRNHAYGYNYQFLGNMRLKASGEYISFPVKLQQAGNASTLVAADANGTAVTVATTLRTPYRPDGSDLRSAVGNHGWALDPPRLTANSDICDPSARSGPDARHRNKLNAVFGDAHVEVMSIQELGYGLSSDGTIPTSGMGATNRYFSLSGQDEDPPRAN